MFQLDKLSSTSSTHAHYGSLHSQLCCFVAIAVAVAVVVVVVVVVFAVVVVAVVVVAVAHYCYY